MFSQDVLMTKRKCSKCGKKLKPGDCCITRYSYSGSIRGRYCLECYKEIKND